MTHYRRTTLCGFVAALISIAASAAPCPTCPNPSFGPALREFTASYATFSLLQGDFNGDGRPDVAVNGVVMLGLPGGLFSPPLGSGFATPFPYSSVVADFDRDGRLDIAGVGSQIGVALGNGDGTFGPTALYPSVSSPGTIAAGDFDGDGYPDLVATLDNGSFAFLRNRADGTFAAPVTYGTQASPLGIAVADFDGDGKLDVYRPTGIGGGLLFLGHGDGTFAAPIVDSFGSGTSEVTAADFNRDGKMDLLLRGTDLRIVYGHGDGTFSPPQTLLADLGYQFDLPTLAVADFNGDGFPDIALNINFDFSVRLALIMSDGAGAFRPVVLSTIADTEAPLLAGDFDGDGIADIVMGRFSGNIGLLQGRGDGTFAEPPALDAIPGSRAAGELTGDGKLDIVQGGSELTVWAGDGTGKFAPAYTFADASFQIVLVGDVNHDGHLDIVGISPGDNFSTSDGYVHTFLGDGAGGFTHLPRSHIPFFPRNAALGNLNADLFPDLVITVLNGYGIAVLKGNGDGTFSGPSMVDSTTLYAGLVLADFDQDGKLDLIGASAYPDHAVVLRRGNGDATFQAPVEYLLPEEPTDIVGGDFSGHGRGDFVMTSNSSPRLMLLRSVAGGGFDPPFLIPGSDGQFGSYALSAADFNGDGHLDLAIGTSSGIAILMGSTGGTFSRLSRYAGGGAPLVGDWNGDGKPDLALNDNNRTSILLNTNCVQRRLVLGTEAATCAVPGSPLSTQPVIQVWDDGANLVSCAAGTITATLAPGTGTPGAVLSGTTSRPTVSGSASFTNLSIDLAGDDYVLRFTDTAFHTTQSRPISVHAATPVSITGPSAVCPTTAAPYSGDPGFDSYLWTLDGIKVGGGSTVQLVGQAVGSHTLAVTAARKGCSASASRPIVVGVTPPAASNSGPVCAGEALQLTASSVPGGTYAWTGPNRFTSAAQNPMIPAATLAASGVYSVTATVTGCTSAPATTSVTVTPLPFVPVAHATGVLCAGETLQLTASTVPGAAYAWTGPNGFTSSLQNPTVPSAIAADSGVYSVTVTVNGCTSPTATTSVSVTACQERPVALSSDSAGNGVLEPGETAVLAPSWLNTTGTSVLLTGAATAFTGPAGATYTIPDTTASYGTVAAGVTASCIATGDCYTVGVSNPASRPVLHWDAAFSEALSTGDGETWSVHIGRSFTDVPSTGPFYRFVETLLHNGVTTGCGGGAYCPASSVTRAQMSVFLLVSQAGSAFTPPPATGVFADVPVSSPFARWIEELARRGVTAGCGSGNFCPDAGVTRAQMAVFLLVAREGAAYVPPAPTGVFPDVPAGNPFAPWIEELFHRGIAAGCGNGNYCPFDPVSRAQMAVFLTATFGLSL